MTSSNWRRSRIDDICRIRRGSSPRPIQEYLSENGIPWVKISDATASNSRYINQTKEYIIEEGKTHSRPVQRGTMILSNSATPGIPKIMGIDACVHDGWLIVDRFENITQEYLYYTFINERERLLNLSNGSVFRNLKTDIVKNYEIEVPPLQEQKAIAHILSTLDEKIEINNRINKTLEEMAQTIFKHWFVDFEFPNEDGEPYKSSGGEMIDSELGPIPKGWEVGSVGDYMRVKSGFAFKSKWWKESGVPVIKIKNLSNGIVDYSDVGYVEVDKIEAAKDFIVKSGDILIAMTGATIGKIGLVYEFNNTILVNQRVGKFFIGENPFEKLPFAFTILTNSRINDEIISLGGGSAQPNISPSQIESIKIAMPISNQVEIFNSLLNPVMRIYVDNIKENAKLQQLRDTLLPKLMSGEIRVPLDIEEQ